MASRQCGIPGVIRFDVVVIVVFVLVAPSPPRPCRLTRGPDIHPSSSLLAVIVIVVVAAPPTLVVPPSPLLQMVGCCLPFCSPCCSCHRRQAKAAPQARLVDCCLKSPPLQHMLLRCCCDALLPQHQSVLRVIDPPNLGKKCIGLLGGSSSINPTQRHGTKGLMWGARGQFPPAAAMVVMGLLRVSSSGSGL